MAILKIARIGHPVLLRQAEPVGEPDAPDIRRLVADMVETMLDAGGVGLAAPQVHVPLRLFVYRLPPSRVGGGPGDEPSDTRVLINPVVEPVGDEQVLGWEGCLSIPGLRAAVPRYDQVAVTAQDGNGEPLRFEASAFHARVVQHENDHLDGVLYPMRMAATGADFRLFGFNEELSRLEAGAA